MLRRTATLPSSSTRVRTGVEHVASGPISGCRDAEVGAGPAAVVVFDVATGDGGAATGVCPGGGTEPRDDEEKAASNASTGTVALATGTTTSAGEEPATVVVVAGAARAPAL